jgi:hypothetical protein
MMFSPTNPRLLWPIVAFSTLLLLIGGVIFFGGTSLFNLSLIGSEPLIVEPVGSTPSPVVQDVILSSPMVVGSPVPADPNGTSEAALETKTGTVICLPKKNPGEFQTMECAYGLQTAEGNYGLSDTDPTYANISGAEMGVEVVVTGRVKPAIGEIYDTIGTIEVVKIENSTL